MARKTKLCQVADKSLTAEVVTPTLAAKVVLEPVKLTHINNGGISMGMDVAGMVLIEKIAPVKLLRKTLLGMLVTLALTVEIGGQVLPVGHDSIATAPTTRSSATRPSPGVPGMPRLREDTPEVVRSYWQRRQAYIARRIATQKADIAEVTKKLMSLPIRDRQEILDDLRAMQQRLSIMESPRYDTLVPIGSLHQVGNVGVMLGDDDLKATYVVVQVLDNSNAILRASYNIGKPGYGLKSGRTQLVTYWEPVIDDPIWISGVDTRGWVDDKAAKMPNPACLVVTGTRTYETASGGSRTIAVVQPIDPWAWVVREDEMVGPHGLHP